MTLVELCRCSRIVVSRLLVRLADEDSQAYIEQKASEIGLDYRITEVDHNHVSRLSSQSFRLVDVVPPVPLHFVGLSRYSLLWWQVEKAVE